MSLSDITAIIFDTYGTVVDWRRKRASKISTGTLSPTPGGPDIIRPWTRSEKARPPGPPTTPCNAVADALGV